MSANNMNDQDERMKILQMVENGRISAGEGATLLGTLTKDHTSEPELNLNSENNPQWFRVRVTDTVTGKRKAIVNIPIDLMDWGLKLGAQFAPELSEVDMATLSRAVRESQASKIVDVVDDVGGEYVEVYIE